MVDFLIVYEHRARELENACLIATELQSRGYSVKIKNVLSLQRYFTSAEVVLAPHLYNDWQVVAIAQNFKLSHMKILDLQYEQVLSQKIKKNGLHNPKESAIQAEHIAWGENQVQKYIENGVPVNNIHNVGCLSMDLNLTIFDKYFKTKDEIAKEFYLDSQKEWVLFISSFAYTNKSKKEIEAYKQLNPDIEEFTEIMNESRQYILDWLEKALLEYENKIFIYRKHPAESEDPYLKELSEKYDNFKCIDDYSIRQWIRVADKFYTWFSTSIADVYFNNKICHILRPVDIPREYDSEFMVGADFIKNYNKFCDSLKNDVETFPISKNVLKKHYSNKEKELVFLHIADLCVKIFNDDSYNKNYNYSRNRFFILNSNSYKKNVKQFATGFVFDISQFVKLSNLFQKLLSKKRIATLKKFEKEVYGVNKEIKDYSNRFNEILSNIH